MVSKEKISEECKLPWSCRRCRYYEAIEDTDDDGWGFKELTEVCKKYNEIKWSEAFD